MGPPHKIKTLEIKTRVESYNKNDYKKTRLQTRDQDPRDQIQNIYIKN